MELTGEPSEVAYFAALWRELQDFKRRKEAERSAKMDADVMEKLMNKTFEELMKEEREKEE